MTSCSPTPRPPSPRNYSSANFFPVFLLVSNHVWVVKFLLLSTSSPCGFLFLSFPLVLSPALLLHWDSSSISFSIQSVRLFVCAQILNSAKKWIFGNHRFFRYRQWYHSYYHQQLSSAETACQVDSSFHSLPSQADHAYGRDHHDNHAGQFASRTLSLITIVPGRHSIRFPAHAAHNVLQSGCHHRHRSRRFLRLQMSPESSKFWALHNGE